MEDDKKSYSDQNAEHKFGYGKQRRSNTGDLKIIRIQDARARGQERNQKNEKIEKGNKRKILGIALIFTLTIVVSSLLFEFYLIPKGWYSVKGNAWAQVVIFLASLFFDQKEISESSEFDASWAEKLFSGGKAIIRVWKHLGWCQLLFWLGLCVFLGQVIGEKGWINDTSRACQAAVYAFRNEEVEIFSDSKTQRPEYINVLSGKDEETLEQIKNSKVSQDEKDRKMNLSQRDRMVVCFEGGENDISGLSQDNANKTVENFVTGRLDQKKENIFDKPEKEGGAPEEVRGKISKASEEEKEAKSFGKAEEILLEREGAYLKYPKASLAKLIANGYEYLALLLLYHDGDLETINYYYGQSILKDFEYLEYEGLSNADIKSRLLKIAQKYEDMMLINSDWKTKFPTIEKLKKAFQYVADQY